MSSITLSVSPAMEEFEKLDWPVRTEENWRFGSWKEANLSGLELVGAGRCATLPAELEGFTRFVFENGQLVTGESPFVELMDKSFGPQSRLGSQKLAALHQVKGSHGLRVCAKEEVSIEIIHLVSGQGLLLPGLQINAQQGSKIRIVERFLSADDSATTVVTAADVRVAAQAHVTYLVTQELNLESRLVRFAGSELEAGSEAKLAVVHTGSRWVREETYCSVNGEDARSEILSIALPTTGQEYDQRTFQHHGARDTYSDLLFKNTLFGSAKTVFSGLIFVDEGAHGTDSYQTCRNLMMADECEANSMPGLEINADDVKCSHGSTSARVSDEEIFYLQARGINARMARSLVAQGFSVEAVEKIEDEQLESLALEVVERKFATAD